MWIAEKQQDFLESFFLFAKIYSSKKYELFNICRRHTRILVLGFKCFTITQPYTHIWFLSAPDQRALVSHVNKRPACL